MKNSIFLIVVLIMTACAYGQPVADWVNNQGCYCGGYLSVPVDFISRGSGTEDERWATLEQMEYWNLYAAIYTSDVNTGFGAPRNGLNEVNTFIHRGAAQAIYGYSMSPSLYGVAILLPEVSFGVFNECQDFMAIGCDYFGETDVLINGQFPDGWTTDPNNYDNALVQTTALHEIGHAWGSHHVFRLPAFGDSYSAMNYINDDSGRFVTRMDAQTIRAHYPGVATSVVDVGIFPLIFGNSSYGETYTSVSPTFVQQGQSIDISNFLVQNIGTSDANNTVITFYLSEDTSIEDADYPIGTVEYAMLPFDADNDLNAAFPVPESMPDGTYYIGAIVTVDGAEDEIGINNRFIVGRPNRTQVTVSSSGSPISLTVTPPADVTIAPGETLGPYIIELTNNTASPYSFRFVRYVTKPDSTSVTWGPTSANISASHTFVKNGSLNIPPWVAEGAYKFGIRINDTGGSEIAHDWFDFTISSAISP